MRVMVTVYALLPIKKLTDMDAVVKIPAILDKDYRTAHRCNNTFVVIIDIAFEI